MYQGVSLDQLLQSLEAAVSPARGPPRSAQTSPGTIALTADDSSGHGCWLECHTAEPSVRLLRDERRHGYSGCELFYHVGRHRAFPGRPGGQRCR